MIAEVDIPYNLERLVAAAKACLERYGTKTANRENGTLRSMSLTHRPGATDPFYDGNNSQYDAATGRILYHESEFSVFNAQLRDTYLFEVYQRVPFKVGRVRLMVMPPLFVYGMHSDGTRRLHMPLWTNPNCFLVSAAGEASHLVAGKAFVAETRKPHTAFNAGDTTRVHLVFSLVEDQ